jgi:hypothetical protein
MRLYLSQLSPLFPANLHYLVFLGFYGVYLLLTNCELYCFVKNLTIVLFITCSGTVRWYGVVFSTH